MRNKCRGVLLRPPIESDERAAQHTFDRIRNRGEAPFALHRRHVEEIDRLIATELTQHANSSLDELIRAMIGAMIDAHTQDPELSELLINEVPHRAGGTEEFSTRLHGAFRLAISSRTHKKKKLRDLDTTVFIVTNMVNALAHGAALRRPKGLSLVEAKEEAVRAVLAYLHA